MVKTTQALCKYIPEWYHLQRSNTYYFKKQSWLFMTRFYKNIGWSQIKNSRNRYLYFLKGEMYYANQKSQHRRDISRARIAAACDEHGFKYQYLMSTLPKIDINLNLQSLATLAIYEPQTFKSLVDIAKAVQDEPVEMANFTPNTLDSSQDLPTTLLTK